MTLTYRVFVSYDDDRPDWNWTLVGSIAADSRAQAIVRARRDYGDRPMALVLADEWQVV